MMDAIIFAMALLGQVAAQPNQHTPPENRPPAVPGSMAGEQKGLDELAARLRELGLQITTDEKKIGAATSEAAYFMFAQRQRHEPFCEPIEQAEDSHWLDGKPVFTAKADLHTIRPLFDKLVDRMGYNEVCVYTANVHYGVDGHARFTLYKLGYRQGDKRRGKQPEVLLGNADYVLNL